MIRSKHVVYCFRTFALVIRCADRTRTTGQFVVRQVHLLLTYMNMYVKLQKNQIEQNRTHG